MNRSASRLLGIVCTAAALLALPDRAPAAALRPHLSSGTAHFISATGFVGTGQATHLGRYSEAGNVTFTPTGNPAVFLIDGTTAYTGSDGDELRAAVVGELNGQTGVITATLTYVGGTGRFTNATGTASLAAQALPDGTISASVTGTVDY